ncbi:MAG: hypothetical protein C0402_16370 [Thermodesulfovibrio sp.]|nr:hypothetical protein [Thermodesulfovibrio sp.]
MKTKLKHDAGGRSRPPWPADSRITSVFSECEQYRYKLIEIWDDTKPLVLWILMNPSVACLEYSDPTLRKTGTFSRRWGYGGQMIGNVHAYRATDKYRLLEVADPVGPSNDRSIQEMAKQAKTIVIAYGKPPGKLCARGRKVIEMLKDHFGLSYLRMAADGVTPCHPLYLPGDCIPKSAATRLAPSSGG